MNQINFEKKNDWSSLCRGAASGEGLGNAFLSNITAVDGIFHVLRTFEDPDVIHTEDRVDPLEDMQIIHNELRAKDIERVTKICDVRSFRWVQTSSETFFKFKFNVFLDTWCEVNIFC